MKRNLNKRAVALLVSLVVVLTAAVGVTLAIVFAGTGPVENTFEPAKVSCAVVEDGKTNHESGQVEVTTKSDVRIQNTGNTDAYIRVTVVATWKNAAGHVWAAKPAAGTDYSIEYDTSNGWVEGSDGYYYYTSPIVPNGLTEILIPEAKQLKDAPQDGYYLSIEIIASAVQSSPADVVGKAWGVAIGNGTVATIPETAQSAD